MNDHTRSFVWIMRLFSLIYFGGAILFFFMPNQLFYVLNIGPQVFRIVEAIPIPSERFWLVLATSMMMMLSGLSLASSFYPKNKSYVMIHMLSKSTSVSGFLYLFFRDQKYFAYVVGAITDSCVILIVMAFYLRSLTNQQTEPDHAQRQSAKVE